MPLPRQLLTLEGGDGVDGIRKGQSSLTHPRDKALPPLSWFPRSGYSGKNLD